MLSATTRRTLLLQNRQFLKAQFAPSVFAVPRKAISSSSVRLSSKASESQSDTAYFPGGPIIKGTINDPTTFPTPSRSHGSHHWAFERLVSASLIPLSAAAAVTSASPYPVLDGILAISLVVHSHIGFDALVVDYLDVRKRPVLGPIMKWTVRLATTGVLVGVYQFNTNDIGLTELISHVWKA